MNQKVDDYLSEGCGRCALGGTADCKVHSWTNELVQLRTIAIACGLQEELKWGVPCYTYGAKNVLIISAFKTYCALSFFKGTLLEDPDDLLASPGENSQSVRFFRFTNVLDIIRLEAVVKAYIFEAIDIEKAGLKVEFRKTPETMPDELLKKLEEDFFFQTAFKALTPGRQRGYILHFSQPKQSSTRLKRIEKCTPAILNGEGLHDRYKAKKQ